MVAIEIEAAAEAEEEEHFVALSTYVDTLYKNECVNELPEAALNHLKIILQSLIPHTTFMLYGSVAVELGSATSDVDVAVQFPPSFEYTPQHDWETCKCLKKKRTEVRGTLLNEEEAAGLKKPKALPSKTSIPQNHKLSATQINSPDRVSTLPSGQVLESKTNDQLSNKPKHVEVNNKLPIATESDSKQPLDNKNQPPPLETLNEQLDKPSPQPPVFTSACQVMQRVFFHDVVLALQQYEGFEYRKIVLLVGNRVPVINIQMASYQGMHLSIYICMYVHNNI